jgi:hypothetical protein
MQINVFLLTSMHCNTSCVANRQLSRIAIGLFAQVTNMSCRIVQESVRRCRDPKSIDITFIVEFNFTEIYISQIRSAVTTKSSEPNLVSMNFISPRKTSTLSVQLDHS